ncbi:LytTR family DNA-binding domain-containing protein [Chitinophaga sp.]|uniref:LytR/AlgR family response regulator transcription factor n=1 Tax=Chitinophaga sp. TaxID=1869181 RepID=UPI0031D6145C
MKKPAIPCIIVDDEAFAAEIISDHIRNIPFLELAGTTTNPIEAIEWIEAGRARLVFLDVQMPGINGLQFMQLTNGKCHAIIVSGFPEYALNGYEHNVIDYLLKPVSFERFVKASQKALQVFRAMEEKPQGFIFLKGDSRNKFIRVYIQDILFIEGMGNYVKVHSRQGNMLTYQTLRELEETLPAQDFHRVHKSYIVAIDKIEMLVDHEIHIGTNIIPVSETYREEFYKRIRKI